MEERYKAVEECFADKLLFWKGDLRSYEFVEEIFESLNPKLLCISESALPLLTR
jgi:hypothetical protein